VVTAINRLDAAQSQKFTYDAANRLTQERRGGEVVNGFDYDAAGNRTALTSDGASKSYRYAPDANRMSEINRQSLSYDARGNLLSDRDGRRGFGYDVTNRLAVYSKNDALKASYSYNASGQRIEKRLHGVGNESDGTRITNFAYTPDGWLLSEIGRKDGGSRTFTDEYIWLGGRPLAKLSRKIKASGDTAQAELIYLHTDHLATPRRASNADGVTVWSWASDAFGSTKAERDPDGDGIKTKLRLRFPGQYYDDESGLHYNHHRDYDPKLGRYIQSDPIGLWGGVNRYGYVAGNPVTNIDPTGLLMYNECYLHEHTSNGLPNGSHTVCEVVVIGDQGGGSIVYGGDGGIVGDGGGGQYAQDFARFSPYIPKDVQNVRVPPARLDHIKDEHTYTGQEQSKGAFRSIYLSSNSNFYERLVLPALKNTTDVRPNSFGRPGYIVKYTFPFSIGSTGTFNGSQSNDPSYTLVMNIRLDTGQLGAQSLPGPGRYIVWTAFPDGGG